LSFYEFCKQFKEELEKICSHALVAGMPYDLFWHGENQALDYYLEKHNIEIKNANIQAHLQSIYFLKALQEVWQDTSEGYKQIFPEQPIDLGLDKPKSIEEQERENEERIKEFFASIKNKGAK